MKSRINRRSVAVGITLKSEKICDDHQQTGEYQNQAQTRRPFGLPYVPSEESSGAHILITAWKRLGHCHCFSSFAKIVVSHPHEEEQAADNVEDTFIEQSLSWRRYVV